MSPAVQSALVLGATLLLFVSEKVRHDLVALIALFASMLLGLVSPEGALQGFADPAVIAVAAVLVVGRAVELSGVAAGLARTAIPSHAPFTLQLSALLAIAALLSALMNNIAALVITMPIATQIARSARKPPAATLMPLAFATILGGMTTLIGTPANLILSSVRQDELGAGFGFFAMTPVGVVVALVGLAYLTLLGWRLLPIRQSAERDSPPPWRVFELTVTQEWERRQVAALWLRLRHGGARILALFRDGERQEVRTDRTLCAGDRVLLISRANQWTIAEHAALESDVDGGVSDRVTARVVVAHGSFLIGQGYEAVTTRSDGKVKVVAAGPRAARQKVSLARLRIEAGDQLYLRGDSANLAPFLTSARLLEIDRFDPVPIAPGRSGAIVAVFTAAILAIVAGGIAPSIAFLGAAGVLAGTRLLPAEEIYRSVDWSIIVLLAAMIPVGQSFETSGAAAIAAQMIGDMLSGQALFVVLAALCALTLLLSIFLNNVATAIIMGPLAIDAAQLLGINPDAALLAVLIGASSDFLTPIGHQNNLLVMGPGGYSFTDYARMGAPLVIAVISVAAITLTLLFR